MAKKDLYDATFLNIVCSNSKNMVQIKVLKKTW